MTRDSGLLTAALRRVRAAVLVPLVGGNLLLLAAAVFALKIPDSHAWQLLLSLLLALGLISGLLLWNATAMRRLRAPANSAPLWKGALLLSIWLFLAALLYYVAGLAEPNVDTRAGYINSQFPAGVRRLLSYEVLVNLQRLAITVFRWVLIPALLLPFAMETATFGLHRLALGRASRVFLSARHWVTAIVTLGIAVLIVPNLAGWHPAHTVSGEMVSAVLRLSVAALVAIGAAMLLLAIDAELLHRRSKLEPLSPAE